MLDTDDGSNYYNFLSARTFLGRTEPPGLSPVNLRTIQDLDLIGIVHLNPVGYVGALDDGNISSKSWLGYKNAFVYAEIAIIHCELLFYIFLRLIDAYKCPI